MIPTKLSHLDLGTKVRLLRENLGKTLDVFCDEIGLPRSLLEQIEKNSVMPPVATLINLAQHCGVDLDYFFHNANEKQSFTITKKGSASEIKRKFPKGKNPLSYRYQSLAQDKSDKKMEPLLVEFSPQKEKVPQVAHDGQEFMYVLTGRIEFNYEDKKKILEKGDSLYFESDKAHSFRALDNKKAKALVVLMPH